MEGVSRDLLPTAKEAGKVERALHPVLTSTGHTRGHGPETEAPLCRRRGAAALRADACRPRVSAAWEHPPSEEQGTEFPFTAQLSRWVPPSVSRPRARDGGQSPSLTPRKAVSGRRAGAGAWRGLPGAGLGRGAWQRTRPRGTLPGATCFLVFLIQVGWHFQNK